MGELNFISTMVVEASRTAQSTKSRAEEMDSRDSILSILWADI